MEEEEVQTPGYNGTTLTDDFDSACSTPFVSAPSSPGRGVPSSYGGGFYYSAPASPVHSMLSSSSNSVSSAPMEGGGGSFEFEFTAKEAAIGATSTGSMSSADELFLNGQIRPMKLSSHLQRPQVLSPLLDVDENEIIGRGDEKGIIGRGRDLKFRERSKSLRRRARSMSPLRNNNAFQWLEEFEDGREATEINKIKHKLQGQEEEHKVKVNDSETTPSGASSRSSSVGRSSKRWVFLKEFLYRSKSEGRNSSSTNTGNYKFWTSLSKKSPETTADVKKDATSEGVKPTVRKAVNGVGKRRAAARSPHELHYTTNRAQAEELRRKTYLPYKQGLLGCLGFSSKSYGAMNGFARALNPVSSR